MYKILLKYLTMKYPSHNELTTPTGLAGGAPHEQLTKAKAHPQKIQRWAGRK